MAEQQNKTLAQYTKKLTISYGVSLLLIAIIATTQYAYQIHFIQNNKGFAQVINTAGKQRMHTQQLMNLLYQQAMGDNNQQQISRVLTQFEQANKLLNQNLSIQVKNPKFFESLNNLYTKTEGINQQTEQFVSKANQLLSQQKIKPSTINFPFANSLLNNLDKAVLLYQRQSEYNVNYFKHMQWLSLLIMYSCLIFIGLSIMYPVTKRIRDNIKDNHMLTFYNPVSNLPNRTHMYAYINKLLEQSSQEELNFSILHIDIDNFKEINEVYGHENGDKFLKHIANKLNSSDFSDYFIAHISTDEFIVIIKDTFSISKISYVAEKYLTHINTTVDIGTIKIKHSASIGIVMSPDFGSDIHVLLKYADMAMHKAKDLGKNRYFFYSDNLAKTVTRNHHISRSIKQAIERDEFHLEYQPQINLNTGEIVGIESLIRWNSENLDNPRPDEFIPIAEKTHQICDIGYWVMNQCLYDFKNLNSNFQLSPDFKISWNVSIIELQQISFLKSIQNIIDNYGIDPSQLKIELTESILIENHKEVLSILDRLKQMGVMLSLDDFGTGYSSLSYLKSLPIDEIKIDKSFIQQSTASQHQIVNAVSNIGKSLNLNLVGEGAEDLEQIKLLHGLNVDIVQGYYFTKPLTIDNLHEYITNHSKTQVKSLSKKFTPYSSYINRLHL